MLGFASVDRALTVRPSEMVSVAPEIWDLLRHAYEGGGLSPEFETAWSNGQAFLEASDGLRRRRPLVIEWKGSHRMPGDEVAPVDLRVDHVFLVSCKYLSRILINASPFHLFERLLQGPHGVRETDWYAQVADEQYQALYRSLRENLGLLSLPARVSELRSEERKQLSQLLGSGWPPEVSEARNEFVRVVSAETARRWQDRVSSVQMREALLWRMLRIGSAPYFVLGASHLGSLRLRVATPWDWRLSFRLREFDVSPQLGGQPRVVWKATVEDRHSRLLQEVIGHVEIRWSHGQFSGNPEAKVYLDTAHGEVPGYFPLA
jgi:hypothetical protein